MKLQVSFVEKEVVIQYVYCIIEIQDLNIMLYVWWLH
jgi:hypothetical protein